MYGLIFSVACNLLIAYAVWSWTLRCKGGDNEYIDNKVAMILAFIDFYGISISLVIMLVMIFVGYFALVILDMYCIAKHLANVTNMRCNWKTILELAYTLVKILQLVIIRNFLSTTMSAVHPTQPYQAFTSTHTH